MLGRKMLGFFVSVPLFALVMIMVVDSGMAAGGLNYIEMFGFVLLFSTPFILILGMPVSALSDFILEHSQGKSRLFMAFGIHVFCGLFFGMILTFVLIKGYFTIVASLVASFVVWIVDELLRYIERSRGK